MPQLLNKVPPDEIKNKSGTDLYGQMPISNWSCLILDVADKLAPMVGVKGKELYFRAAQAWEAKETAWEGEDEAKFTAIMAIYYVDLSLNSFQDITRKFGTTVEVPPYPPDEPWINVDVEIFVYSELTLLYETTWIRIPWEAVPKDEPMRGRVTFTIDLIYQLQDNPQYGIRRVQVATFSTTWAGALNYFRSVAVMSRADRVDVVKRLLNKSFDLFEYKIVFD